MGISASNEYVGGCQVARVATLFRNYLEFVDAEIDFKMKKTLAFIRFDANIVLGNRINQTH